ncbi:MAG: glycoside hydrolase family 127 protein [Prevotella sp.]|nr:glycoside hydrolase family 127 protein [Prevotella sp.]
MKKFYLIALLLICLLATNSFAQDNHYPITPVPFTAVKVTPGTFWGQRLEASRTTTIPLAFSKCEETGRYLNFIHATEHMKDPSKTFPVSGFSFDDTDPYKTIEGASYLLQTFPDKKLAHYVDSIIDIIGAAQEPDGYLYTARTQNPNKPHNWSGNKRWVKEEDLSHELYNLGHMIEGAIAHYQATGSRKFLDIAIRYADCVCREVGPNPGQACVVPGHQIAEMALAKLYLVTGDKKYLDEAKFFLDYRGKTEIKHDYSQAHLPVIQQKEAVGHAVRAAYMYAGMADVAALTGDTAYIHAIDAIWDNIVSKKLYITGGIGATNNGEAFGKNYELPNMSAYCETCAAIGNVYVNHRLFLLHGESKYYDVLERTLYNGLISGVSLQGNGFFYPNPLASMGQHQRQPWFGCACCPSNICRFIPSLPGYVYAVKDRSVYVNLFLSNKADLSVAGKKVSLTQTTSYPWEENITIHINKNEAGRFALKIRIPGWVRNRVVPSDLYQYTDDAQPVYRFAVNDKELYDDERAIALTDDGYFTIERKWKKGDKIQIHFCMEPRVVRANNEVTADQGMVSIERGPLVYCAEHPDNNFDIMSILLNQNPVFEEGEKEIAGTTVKTLSTKVQQLSFNEKGLLTTKEENLTLIPYYAWCHRGSGKMRVWLSQDLSSITPATPPTLASRSKLTASTKTSALSAVSDGLVPKNKNDRSIPYYDWWPKKDATEWLVYELPEEMFVKSSTVYWFEDQPWGGCGLPTSWKIYYKDERGQWQPVTGVEHYPVIAGNPCTVNFNMISTKALKLEVKISPNLSAGLFEWSVR